MPVTEGNSARTVSPNASGPVMFARYAFPPNQHGYCGPNDAAGFFSRGVTGDDDGLRQMARDFDGALPFLTMISAASRITDPLDPRIVEAYWVGSPLLDRPLGLGELGSSQRWSDFPHDGLPHHAYAVFCVYPWSRMLGDPRRTPQAMIVLDGCRIRWGQVVAMAGDRLTVESQRLVWQDGQLSLGPEELQTVRRSLDGLVLSNPISSGDWVALHWDWVCDTLSPAQCAALQHYSGRQLEVVNAQLRQRLAAAGG